MLPAKSADLPPRPARAAIAAFSLDGRISARQDQTRHFANVSWQHRADSDDILLTTPLGQGVAELGRDARGTHLVTADRQTVDAQNWDELSARVFGFTLPLADMPRWLLGDVAAGSRDELGRPQSALIDGWEIRYADYESAAADALPALVEFRRGDIEVRIKVDAWQTQ